MDFDDTSNIELVLDLGLALHDQYSAEDFDGHKKRESKKKKLENSSKCNKAYPSLTLGPPKEADEENNKIKHSASKIESCDQNLVTTPIESSSFSNSSIKRETCEEFEVEIEKVPTRLLILGNVDEDGNPRKKLRLTKDQLEVLEENFKEHSTLNPKQKQALAKKLNLQARQVEVWFQNRRARTKLKQTESDFELLKKSYETLTEENKKLQKELQELKSMQTVATTPFYMQIPAATLTNCPSCETICGGNNNINNGSLPTSTLLIESNSHHHFYTNNNNYSYPHPSSTTC